MRQAERDAVEHSVLFEGELDFVEHDCISGRSLVRERWPFNWQCWYRHGLLSRRSQVPSVIISSRVMNTSTAMMRIIEATTASVVARPTPCVPPLVLKP